MVFQDPYGSLHPRQTVDRALAEPLVDPRHRRPPTRASPRRCARSGSAPRFRFRYPHQLSGGQRQRVAIARALMPRAAGAAAGRADSALDVSVAGGDGRPARATLRRGARLTYVLVSHNLAVVAQLCDRVGVMREGRFAEELPTAALLARVGREFATMPPPAASPRSLASEPMRMRAAMVATLERLGAGDGG